MSSLVLAFDTATDTVALGLSAGDGRGARRVIPADFEARRAALSRLVPAISKLLAAESREIADVTGIVVGIGPGSLTGVRIGVATAKGLARALAAPLHGVGTLDAVAWRHRDAHGLVGVVGDAMRGEVYPALFRVEAGRVERITAHTVASPAEAAASFAGAGEPVLLVGDGLRRYREVFASVLGGRGEFGEAEGWAPSSAGLIAAWEHACETGTTGDGDPATLLPVYTRLSDAEENERR